MCRCVCVRACAGEEREIATYMRLVRPANWVGDRLVSRLPYRWSSLWDTDRGACGCAHECGWPRVSTSLHVLYAVRTDFPLKHLDTHRKRHEVLSRSLTHIHTAYTHAQQKAMPHTDTRVCVLESGTHKGGQESKASDWESAAEQGAACAVACAGERVRARRERSRHTRGS